MLNALHSIDSLYTSFGTIGYRKSSSKPCYIPKVVLFKKLLRNAEFISALDYRKVCLKSVDKSVMRCKKQLLFLCIALQSGS